MDVYKLAKQMAVEIHRMTLDELPKFEWTCQISDTLSLLPVTCYLLLAYKENQ